MEDVNAFGWTLVGKLLFYHDGWTLCCMWKLHDGVYNGWIYADLDAIYGCAIHKLAVYIWKVAFD